MRSSAAGCVSATGGQGFTGTDIAQQTGAFSLSFDATAGQAPTDVVIGLSAVPAAQFSDYAAAVRFNSSGNLDAINDSGYAAATSVPYAAGTTYHVRMEVDVPSHRYSVYVKPDSGTEHVVASDYLFRTAQAGVTQLSRLNLIVDATSGTASVCGATIADTTPPAVSITSPANGQTLSGTVTVSISASDDVGVAGVQLLVDGAVSGAEVTGLPYSVSLDTTVLSSGSHTLTARARDAAGNTTTSAAVNVTVASSPGSCLAATGGQGFVGTDITQQIGAFSLRFDATVGQAPTDVVIGLSAVPAAQFSNLAAAVRFNSSGGLDAINDSSYAAATAITYVANTTYHIRMEVNVPSHRYSVYVKPGTGTEQVVASDYLFRTAQAGVTQLNRLSLIVDATSGAASVCGLAVESTPGTDTAPPTVSITAPGSGSTVSGTISVSANASDNVGVVGVRFMVDGTSIGTEDTTPPYSISYDTSALSNGSHTLSARARDAAGNSTTSAAVNVTVGNQPPSGNHPRIFLDTSALSALRSRAQAGVAEWTRLRNECNSYLGGTVNPVGGNAYPNRPDIGEGYQGSDYVPALLAEALCYQIGVGIGDGAAAQWGQKGSDILDVMSQFTNYSRDSGYGIRNFGVGMSLGYDWLYPVLSSSVRSRVYTSLNGWMSWYDANGFGRGHPHGNYFAGYYAAKAYAALATEGDNSSAPAMWSDFLNRMHFGGAGALSGPEGTHEGVQSFYSKYLVGGGAMDGWGYGPLEVGNMGLPSLAAKTAKGIDLIDNAKPYSYPIDNGLHFIHLAWPTRVALDDRDMLHTGADYPSAPSSTAVLETAYLLRKWGDPQAAKVQAFAHQIRTEQGTPSPWVDMLFWDGSAREEAYDTLPRSFLAKGVSTAAMRSDWTPSATWASFRAVGYVDNPYSGEQNFDAGGLAIVKGGTPFLTNPTGALAAAYPGTSATDENNILDDTWGSGGRQLSNTFFNGSGSQTQVLVDEGCGTRVAAFEDGGGYVRLRGESLEDVYTSGASLTSWTRDVVYLRPGAFVVYDRTVVSSVADPHMHWHLYQTPRSASAPSTGAVRYDVTDGGAGFLGSMTTLLPQSANTSVSNPFGNKVYRVVVRAGSPASSMKWLTVFETGASASAVALSSVASTSSNVVGALLVEGGANKLVLFNTGSAGSNVSGTVTASVPAAATALVATDLLPNTSYKVTASGSGSLSIAIQPGTGFTTTANGTLYVNLSSSGAVTAGN